MDLKEIDGYIRIMESARRDRAVIESVEPAMALVAGLVVLGVSCLIREPVATTVMGLCGLVLIHSGAYALWRSWRLMTA